MYLHQKIFTWENVELPIPVAGSSGSFHLSGTGGFALEDEFPTDVAGTQPKEKVKRM